MSAGKTSTTPLAYSLRRSERAKKTRIIVTADKIEVVAPPKVSERNIKAFVDAQQDWIKQALKRIAGRVVTVARLAPHHYIDGVAVPYQGQHLVLSIKPTNNKTLRVQLLSDTQLAVYLPTAIAPADSSPQIRQALERWMKAQARQHIAALVDKHAATHALFPRSIRIKTQKSRWGSCGPQNDINMNWLLMLAPPVVMEYVVVHELCHIKHKNHSRDFWQLVAEHMPDYLHQRRWLKQHGASLMQGL